MPTQPARVGHGVVVYVGDDFASRRPTTGIPRSTETDSALNHVASANLGRQTFYLAFTLAVVHDDQLVTRMLEPSKSRETARQEIPTVARTHDDRAGGYGH
jgi:hypothetical protein